MAPIRLFLLDDHDLFRASLAFLLSNEADFTVVGHSGSAAETLRLLSESPVDLLLLDYDLGQCTGIDFIRNLRLAGACSRVFIVTAGLGEQELLAAIGLGVCGVFLKHGPPEVLNEAIRRVIQGETWIDPKCLESLQSAISAQRFPSPENDRRLSEREAAVLRGIFDGQSNKEIATLLNLSESSVKSVIQQLFLKRGVRTRSQLVRIALEEFGHAR